MTTASPTPAFENAPAMAHAPDIAPQAPPAQAPPTQTGTTAAARPTLRAQIAENPLLSFFGALIVVLLAAAIASPNIRISDTNARIDRLEDTMEARFAAQDAKIEQQFGELDAKIDRLDAKFDAKMDAKIDRLDAKMDAKIDRLDAKMDAKIDRLDAKIDEMNLKLTALIAALQMTGIVEATLDGSLNGPDGANADGRDESF